MIGTCETCSTPGTCMVHGCSNQECGRAFWPSLHPAGPDEAEKIAARIVGEYLSACRMTDRAQIGNYLMKLCSVAGVVMAQAEDSVTAFERLQGTAHFVLNNCPATPATLVRPG